MAKNNISIEDRKKLALIGLASILVSYLIFLRATHTGSLQQYGLLLIFLFYGINRLFRVLAISFK